MCSRTNYSQLSQTKYSLILCIQDNKYCLSKIHHNCQKIFLCTKDTFLGYFLINFIAYLIIKTKRTFNVLL